MWAGMKILPMMLGGALLALGGCATQDMIAKAQGRPGPLDPPDAAGRAPQPGYYVLVPLVLPFDLVAWPFEYFYMKDRQPTADPDVQPHYYQPPSPDMTPYRPGQPGTGGSW